MASRVCEKDVEKLLCSTKNQTGCLQDGLEIIQGGMLSGRQQEVVS